MNVFRLLHSQNDLRDVFLWIVTLSANLVEKLEILDVVEKSASLVCQKFVLCAQIVGQDLAPIDAGPNFFYLGNFSLNLIQSFVQLDFAARFLDGELELRCMLQQHLHEMIIKYLQDTIFSEVIADTNRLFNFDQ